MENTTERVSDAPEPSTSQPWYEVTTTSYERQRAYRDQFIGEPTENQSGGALILEAYRINQMLATELPEDALIHVAGLVTNYKASSDTSDFSAATLVRVYFLTKQGTLLPEFQRVAMVEALAHFPYWINFPDRGNKVCHWTENHQCMCLTSLYLLAHDEKFTTLHPYAEMAGSLLLHWLSTKTNFGFYEINSGVYLQYTLAGLLNLVDFCKDGSIRELGVTVLESLIRNVAACAMPDAQFISATTRSNDNDLTIPDERGVQAVLHVFFALPRVGPHKNRCVSFPCAAVATSRFVEDAGNKYCRYWNPDGCVEMIGFGHPSIDDCIEYHSKLDEETKLCFYFSAGLFFHPAVIDKNLAMMDKLGLWSHHHFKDFTIVNSFPSFMLPGIGSLLESVTRGHCYAMGELVVYRNGPVCMSSLRKTVSHCTGYQKLPFVVRIGPIVMWLESGLSRNYSSKTGARARIRDAHLPRVVQEVEAENTVAATLTYSSSYIGSWFHSQVTGSTGSGVQLLASSDDVALTQYMVESAKKRRSVCTVEHSGWSLAIESHHSTRLMKVPVRPGVWRYVTSEKSNQTWKLTLSKMQDVL